MTAGVTNGVIHDIGYQRYRGPRLGRGYAVGSLFTHSLRTAYGLGRTAKAKIFPWLAVGIVAAVGVVLTAIRAGMGESVVPYAELPDGIFFVLILFCAAAAPELVSRDLRSGVLPLYFSRPVRRADYALAKLAALVTAGWLLLAGPMLVMYVGGVFSVDGWRAVWDETRDFAGGLAYAALFAVVFGVIALLVASLVSRRAVAAGAIVAVFLATTPVVGVLSEAGGPTAASIAGLFHPATLVLGVRQWLAVEGEFGFGPLYGAVTLALVLACTGFLLLRYRKVQQ